MVSALEEAVAAMVRAAERCAERVDAINADLRAQHARLSRGLDVRFQELDRALVDAGMMPVSEYAERWGMQP